MRTILPYSILIENLLPLCRKIFPHENGGKGKTILGGVSDGHNHRIGPFAAGAWYQFLCPLQGLGVSAGGQAHAQTEKTAKLKPVYIIILYPPS
ncbi:MAG TPA: hypothetical protein GX504_02645 [Clostridia bacterium]|nr:hypothetical protein [Clostridia bacterium]